MIDLYGSKLTDALPMILGQQDWIKALSQTQLILDQQAMDYAEDGLIYTNFDNLPEKTLDVMAVNMKIDWYKPDYDLDTKKKLVKTAMIIRRTLGTKIATAKAVDAIYPGSVIQEWFEYNGDPGFFRILLDVTYKSETITEYAKDEMEQMISWVKKGTAHLYNIYYMIQHPLVIKNESKLYMAQTPECGKTYCGVWNCHIIVHSSLVKLGISDVNMVPRKYESIQSGRGECGLTSCGMP